MMTTLLLLAALAQLSCSCRWAMLGSSSLEPLPTSAAALFSGPEHSLAVQSHSEAFTPFVRRSALWEPAAAALRNHKCNRDGWGVGWVRTAREEAALLHAERGAAAAAATAAREQQAARTAARPADGAEAQRLQRAKQVKQQAVAPRPPFFPPPSADNAPF